MTRMDKVRDESYVNETVLNDPVASRGDESRLGKLLFRYWADAVVVAIALILWLPRLSGPIDLRWDAGVYYVLGTSLASGQGYRILSEPGSPEALQYPPGLPAVVAVHEWILGTTDPAVVGQSLRRFNAFVFVAYALAILALAKKYLRPWLALVAAAMCLLQIMTIFLSDLLFTELPFALVSVIFALVAVDGPLASRPRVREVASFVLAAAGVLLRAAGVALFVAWVIEALARRNWRQAAGRGILALLPILLWQAHVQRVRTSYEYAHPAYEYQRAPYQFYNVSYAENVSSIDASRFTSWPRHGLAARLITNVPKMVTSVGETISTSERYWRQILRNVQQWSLGRQVIPLGLALVLIIGLSAVVATGVAILARRRAWLMVGIIVASLALTCATPWTDQFERYLMPLAPFLAIAALLALSQLYTTLRTSAFSSPIKIAAQSLLAGLILLVLILQAYAAGELFYQRERRGVSFVRGMGGRTQHFFYQGNAWRNWEEAVAWIGAHTPPEAIIATPQRHLCYLLANRRAVLPPMESDAARARRLLEAVPVSYVIVDEIGELASFGRRYALPAVQSDPLRWHIAHSISGTLIYERVNGSD